MRAFKKAYLGDKIHYCEYLLLPFSYRSLPQQLLIMGNRPFDIFSYRLELQCFLHEFRDVLDDNLPFCIQDLYGIF